MWFPRVCAPLSTATDGSTGEALADEQAPDVRGTQRFRPKRDGGDPRNRRSYPDKTHVSASNVQRASLQLEASGSRPPASGPDAAEPPELLCLLDTRVPLPPTPLRTVPTTPGIYEGPLLTVVRGRYGGIHRQCFTLSQSCPALSHSGRFSAVGLLPQAVPRLGSEQR